MRRIVIITIAVICILVSFGCNSGVKEQDASQLESINEVEEEKIYEFGTKFESDLNLDGKTQSITVYKEEAGVSVKVEYLVDSQARESISRLTELDGMLMNEKYRFIQGVPEPILAIYAKNGDEEENQIYFYTIEEDMEFHYKGKIVVEDDFMELGKTEFLENAVILDGKSYEIVEVYKAPRVSTKERDEVLDYLGMTAQSIVLELGEADFIGQSGLDDSWAYVEEGLEIKIAQDEIVKVCITSGRVLGIEVNQEYLEGQWEDYERYALTKLLTSSNDYLEAQFDYEKYFLEIHLKKDNTNMKVVSICVSLSELYQARIAEEHVVVDRFGNLLFAENEDSWSIELEKENGWMDINIIGYERENAVLFFQADRMGAVGVYHYDLLKKEVTLLRENPETVDFSGGVLSIYSQGERRYFDLGGEDVTDEIMGVNKKEIQVEFYIQSDTLFYLPQNIEDYTILKNLSQLLENKYSRIETYFDAESNRGFLSAFKDEDEMYDLYLFNPSLGQIKLLGLDIIDYKVTTVNGEKRLALTMDGATHSITKCYDVDGELLENCD